MALIKCSECGRDVSSQASACPNCGCPIPATPSAPASVPLQSPPAQLPAASAPAQKHLGKGCAGCLGIVVAIVVIVFIIGLLTPTQIIDGNRRPIPAVGREARLIEGDVLKDEQAVAEFMRPDPELVKRSMSMSLSVSPSAGSKLIKDEAAKRTESLLREGKQFRVGAGTRIRILGYFTGGYNTSFRLIQQGERADWAKVEFLEGEHSQQVGFVPAAAIE